MDLSKEIDALVVTAKESKDPYFLSLTSLSLTNRNRTREAEALLKRVAEAQKADGHLDAAQTSITGSGGQSLQIETTALAALAWMRDPRALARATVSARSIPVRSVSRPASTSWLPSTKTWRTSRLCAA